MLCRDFRQLHGGAFQGLANWNDLSYGAGELGLRLKGRYKHWLVKSLFNGSCGPGGQIVRELSIARLACSVRGRAGGVNAYTARALSAGKDAYFAHWTKNGDKTNKENKKLGGAGALMHAPYVA